MEEREMSKPMGMVAVFGFVLLFIASPMMCPAEEHKVYSLDESIAEALDKNWTIKTKEEKIVESQYAKKKARSDFLPKLSTTYGYTRLSEARSFRSNLMGGGEIAVSSQDNYQWKGTLTQPLFTGFALLSAYELAKLGIDQSELELKLERLDIALRVKQAYFGVLEADKRVIVAEKAVEALESQVKTSKSFYDVGMIPVNDLLKAEVELANAQHDLIKAQNTAKLARTVFNVVLARKVSDPVHLFDITEYSPDTGALETYMKAAVEKRPEIEVLDVNILQAEQQKRLAKSRFYPEISLRYDYIKEGDEYKVQGSAFHDAGRWEAMAVMEWTFWEWGGTYYETKEKESLITQLIHTRESLKDQIEKEVKQAYLDLEESEKNIPVAKKAVEQGEENLRVSTERYKAQVTTSTEVLDAQTLLTEARTNYYRALYSHHLAKARLQRALGEM
jgi:outer membrane protein TolC